MQKFTLAASALIGGYLLAKKQNADCCGIIGIVSGKRKNIAEPLSMGVELLKNRGYDSAGIVTFNQEEGKVNHQILKSAEEGAHSKNCIDRLLSSVSKEIVKSKIGIGHTRWATCGEKLVKNAHPHYDGANRIFLVHNGIISGYSEIKSKYLTDVVFNSDTDSEVIAQLIGKMRAEGLNMVESIRKAEAIIRETSEKPQWGIVLMDKEQPNKIWTSTQGSPILIGLSQDQIFVASESIAFKKEVDSYFVTENGEIFELSIDNIQKIKEIMNKAGRLIKISEKDKEGVLAKPPPPFKSFYRYEISQQAELVFKPEFERIKAVPFHDHLTLIACGSSYYAALSSVYFFKNLKAFKKIGLHDPVEMVEGDICENETIVMISQSGETKDLINIIEECNKIDGVNTIGIINVEGSTIARKVTFPIYIKAGREVSVAATKSMFHQCLNLVQLAVEVATKKQSAPESLLKQISTELLGMPEKVRQTILMVDQTCDQIANMIWEKESLYLLGIRETMAIAKEAALKIKELNYIHAEALGACEMKHGPIALIESDKPETTTVLLFILDNSTFEIMMNAVDQMYSRKAKVILVTNCRERIIEHYDSKPSTERVTPVKQIINDLSFIEVPKLEHLSHLLCLIPMQILVEKISILKKIDPDMPRNLAKTVTV